MHYLLEVIIPNSENIKDDLENLMSPFCEHNEENNHAFYDYYEIGGRYSGSKLMSKLDKEKLKLFHEELKNKEITVSGLVFGKQELSPKEQIPLVDKLWVDFFPESGIIQCPIFKHYNGNLCDIEDFKDVSKNHECCSVLIGYKKENEMEATFLIEKEIWNGVNWIETKWNGTIKNAIEMYNDEISIYSKEYLEEITPKDDWKVISVDIHQ